MGVALFVRVSAGRADDTQTHEGVYVHAAIGGGYSSVVGTTARSVRTGRVASRDRIEGGSIAFDLALGATLREGVVLGGGVVGVVMPDPTFKLEWSRYGGSGRVSQEAQATSPGWFAVIGPFVTWRPRRDTPRLHVTAHAGYARLSTMQTPSDAAAGASATPVADGLGVAIGLGYDAWSSDKLAVPISCRIQYASVNEYFVASFNVLTGIVWH